MVRSNYPILSKVGTCLSIICVIAIWVSWYLLPRWRSLHNYIGANQITFGTLQMIFLVFIQQNQEILHNVNPIVMYFISVFLFHATLSWSLSSALLAYFKLVLIHNGAISYAKTLVTIFVCGLTVSFKLICLVIVKQSESLNIERAGDLEIIPLFWIMTLIIAIFVRVVVSVMSCFKKSASKRNAKHVLALFGVAILSDVVTVIWMSLSLILVYNWIEVWFYLRLVLHSLFLLLNTQSRKHWKQYIRKRQRMAVVI